MVTLSTGSVLCSWPPAKWEQFRYMILPPLSPDNTLSSYQHLRFSLTQLYLSPPSCHSTPYFFHTYSHSALFHSFSFSSHPLSCLPFSISIPSLPACLSALSFSLLAPVECNNVNVICSASIKHTILHGCLWARS